MALALATATRNALINALTALIDAGAGAGTIKVYTGASPGPNAAVTGTLLATFTLNDPAFGAGAAGVATMDNTPVPTATGLAAGTAGYFRLEDSVGTDILDGSVTATGGGGDIELNTTTISVGLALEITNGTLTQPQ